MTFLVARKTGDGSRIRTRVGGVKGDNGACSPGLPLSSPLSGPLAPTSSLSLDDNDALSYHFRYPMMMIQMMIQHHHHRHHDHDVYAGDCDDDYYDPHHHQHNHRLLHPRTLDDPLLIRPSH